MATATVESLDVEPPGHHPIELRQHRPEETVRHVLLDLVPERAQPAFLGDLVIVDEGDPVSGGRVDGAVARERDVLSGLDQPSYNFV